VQCCRFAKQLAGALSHQAVTLQIQLQVVDGIWRESNRSVQTPTSRSRPKAGTADSRVQISHIFRLMAGNMQPGTLRSNRLVRTKFIDFINDSLRFVVSAASGD